MEIAAVQRRTLRLLFVTQVISGIAIAIGASVGALLAADIAGISVSGIAQSAIVVGAALFALPATAIVNRHGRPPSLAAGYIGKWITSGRARQRSDRCRAFGSTSSAERVKSDPRDPRPLALRPQVQPPRPACSAA